MQRHNNINHREPPNDEVKSRLQGRYSRLHFESKSVAHSYPFFLDRLVDVSINGPMVEKSGFAIWPF